MTSVGSEHVEAAVSEMTRVLMPHADADWQVQAGSLKWNCWETAAHVAHDLVAYAGQVAGGATVSYLPFDLVVAPSPPREVLEVVAACGRLLSVVVEHADPETVAWHWGMSDAAGFAAMGVGETLAHSRHFAGSWRELATPGISEPTCRRPSTAHAAARPRLRCSALGHRQSGS